MHQHAKTIEFVDLLNVITPMTKCRGGVLAIIMMLKVQILCLLHSDSQSSHSTNICRNIKQLLRPEAKQEHNADEAPQERTARTLPFT